MIVSYTRFQSIGHPRILKMIELFAISEVHLTTSLLQASSSPYAFPPTWRVGQDCLVSPTPFDRGCSLSDLNAYRTRYPDQDNETNPKGTVGVIIMAPYVLCGCSTWYNELMFYDIVPDNLTRSTFIPEISNYDYIKVWNENLLEKLMMYSDSDSQSE
jgi:hypothetical protein